MKKNFNLLDGLHNSQKLLLKLTQKGLSRQLAYSIVQKNAMNSWENNSSFYSNIISDKKITAKIPVNKTNPLSIKANWFIIGGIPNSSEVLIPEGIILNAADNPLHWKAAYRQQ